MSRIYHRRELQLAILLTFCIGFVLGCLTTRLSHEAASEYVVVGIPRPVHIDRPVLVHATACVAGLWPVPLEEMPAGAIAVLHLKTPADERGFVPCWPMIPPREEVP